MATSGMVWLLGARTIRNSLPGSLLNNRLAASPCACARYYSSVKQPEDHSIPLKFTTSKAATWQAKHTRTGGIDDSPWYQPYVISLSLTIFLVYFCILREESDIDQEMDKTLYERISGLEEKQLEISLAYNQQHGISTDAIIERLEELRPKVEK